MGDIASLARSIADVGLLHPIVVKPAGGASPPSGNCSAARSR